MPTATVGIVAMLDSLAALLARGNYSVHLFVNNFTPNVTTALASFTEASYDTYPLGGITPALPSFGTVGNEAGLSPVSITFPAPTSGGPFFAYGFWVRFTPNIVGGGPAMLMASRFGTMPKILAVGGDPLPLTLNFGDLDLNHP